MKRTMALAVVFAFMIAYASPAFAELPKPVDKAYHGLEKIVKSPKHLLDHPIEEFKVAKFKPFGLLGGIMKGVCYTVVDTVHGAVDVVTSPLELLPE
ncbi:MAG: hypothetical protein Q8Q08_07530 [Candidatus Omnitrophota bacterium]|nr:hypothetical protein [Candidatus Omnitrophota bacterium]MDZ4243198.1 hypothetical protein [Candidatus Omnitrophota bacterium]